MGPHHDQEHVVSCINATKGVDSSGSSLSTTSQIEHLTQHIERKTLIFPALECCSKEMWDLRRILIDYLKVADCCITQSQDLLWISFRSPLDLL